MIAAYYNPQDSVFHHIAEASAQTATNTSLGSFDWTSLIIAAIALIVSFYSLYYAIITLRVSRKALFSQERTEKNTRRISQNTQSDLLSAVLSDTFHRYAKVCALQLHLKKHNFTCYPSRKFLNDLKLSTTYIQENSADEDSTDTYIALAMIKEKVRDYNEIVMTYASTISNQETTNELREDSIMCILLELKEITNSLTEILKNHYSNASGNSLERLFCLPTAELSQVPTYPIFDMMIANHSSTLNILSSHYIESITENNAYTHNGIIVTQELLKSRLAMITAACLSSITSWCLDFDISPEMNIRYIPTWSGILLPMPSISKRGFFNFGKIELFFDRNELRLYCYSGCLIKPTITFFRGEEKHILFFNPVKDAKGLATIYYMVVFDDLEKEIDQLLRYEGCVIEYMIPHTPSTLSDSEEASELYKTTMSTREFNVALYAARITAEPSDIDSQIDAFINRNTSEEDGSSNNYSEDGYEVAVDSDGEVYLIINRQDSPPEEAKLIIDYNNNMVLYRNPKSSMIFTNIEKIAAGAILPKTSVTIIEQSTNDNGEPVEERYHVSVVIIKSIEALLS